MYKKYILYVFIFLIIGEIIHTYYKLKNNNLENKIDETFQNYNELPTLTNMNKSYPRNINTISYKPDLGLQSISIVTKIPTLITGKLPVLGYYGNNLYASKIPISIIRHYVLPIEYKKYITSLDVFNSLNNNNIELGLFRDYDMLTNLKTINNRIEILIPLYYETIYFLTSKELKDLSHFQNINLEEKALKLFTTKNDKYILDKIIKICNIDNTKLEIYTFDLMENASANFILNPKSILFICCHFKNGILQTLLNKIECLVLPYIPNKESLIAIGNYNQKNPINNEKLLQLINYYINKLKNEFDNVYSSIINHNLSKNKLINRNGKHMYKTIKIRNSIYISKINDFTTTQLTMFSENIVKWYQTMGNELNKWNTIKMLNNIDEQSFNLNEIAVISKKIKIEDTMNNKLYNLKLISN